MTTLLAKIIADFTTSLATEIAIGGTTATLQSATDDDGVALPAGRYFFTLDGANSVKEHISADLSGTALTNIKTVSRQGVEAAGVLRKHRIGATVSITDFAHIFQIYKLVSGGTQFNSATPLAYDGAPVLTPGSNEFATVKYADDLAIAGAPDASTTQKGIVEEATLAEVLARTTAGGTSARLFVNPGVLPSTLVKDYAIDTGAADAYAIAPTPAITAYVTGQVFVFKSIHANTTASTLAVSGLATKTIKNSQGNDLVANDILNGQIVVVVYDGTNMQMINSSGVGYVKLAGAQTVAGVKTFSSSPIAPTPSSATDVAIKSYVDDQMNLRAPANLTDAYTAGEYIISEAPQKVSTTSSSYAKVQEIKVAKAGVVRLYAQYACNSTNDGAKIRFYVNGIAVGSEATVNNTTTYVTYTEDFTIAAGDLVQVYAKCTTGTVNTKNFRVKVANPLVAGFIGADSQVVI